MRYINIKKELFIPRTERQLYIHIQNGPGDYGVQFWFSPPFTYRGFELEFKIMWLSFGICWNMPF